MSDNNERSGSSKKKGTNDAPKQEDSFEARPTNRLGKDHKIVADGDTWQEMMAVCEAPEEAPGDEDSGRLVIRSYYQSIRTNERVWDEPPSGATNVIPASDEMRRMATLQLEELHVVDTSKKKKKKKSIIGKMFGKKKDKKKEEEPEKRKIQYRPGSQMYANQAPQDTEEALMQEAIAASIAESRGETYVSSKQNVPTANPDEELLMAQALSMSAAEHEQQQAGDATDEVVLAQVMEQSKLETKRGEGNLLNLTNPNIASNIASNSYDNPISAEDDRKMPAGPPMMRPPPSQQTMPYVSSPAATSATSPYVAAAMPYVSSPAATSATSQYVDAAPNGTTPLLPTLKAPPTYAGAPNAAAGTAPAAASGNLTPPSTSPVPNPAAMFDPYSKDAPAPAGLRATDSPPTPPRSNLKKMGYAKEASSKLSRFKRSSSTKKMQDKAGLV
jgi:hypothetical protein